MESQQGYAAILGRPAARPPLPRFRDIFHGASPDFFLYPHFSSLPHHAHHGPQAQASLINKGGDGWGRGWVRCKRARRGVLGGRGSTRCQEEQGEEGVYVRCTGSDSMSAPKYQRRTCWQGFFPSASSMVYPPRPSERGGIVPPFAVV